MVSPGTLCALRIFGFGTFCLGIGYLAALGVVCIYRKCVRKYECRVCGTGMSASDAYQCVIRPNEYCCHACLADFLWDQRGETKGTVNFNSVSHCFNNCGAQLTFGRIQQCLPKAFVNRFENALTESRLKMDNTIVWCSCGTIYEICPASKTLRCVSCKRESCLQCNRTKHSKKKHECKAVRIDDTKKCSQCGALVEKIRGCDSIKCKQCGTALDYKRLDNGEIYI